MAKESYRLNAFYCIEESNMWYNKEYPPFFTLFEVLWCYMCGAFKERYLYQSLTFFELALFAPLFDNYKKNYLKQLLLIIICILIGFVVGPTSGLVYNTLVYNSIYLDWPIAYLLAFAFYYIYSMNLDETKDYIGLSIVLSSLILSKQIALAFYLLLIVTLLIKITLNKKLSKKILIIFIPLLFYVSWSLVLKRYNISSKFSFNDYNFFIIFDYFKHGVNEIENTIITNFLNAFVNRAIILKPVDLSYIALSFIITLSIVIASFIKKNKDYLIISILYLLGSIGYAYSLLLSYVFDFGYLEGPSLAMFDRYALTYIFAGFILLIMLFSELFKESIKCLIVTLLTILLFIQTSSIKYNLPSIKYNGYYTDTIGNYVELVNEVVKDDKLVVINQNDGLKRCALMYYLDSNKDILYLDLSYPVEEDAYSKGKPYWEEDFWKLLYEYDYIYISDVEDSFEWIYWDMVTSEELIIDKLYKIEHLAEHYVKITPIDNDALVN